MNAEKLSKRLERVAGYIPNGAILADIGSDHAYLPCYAIKENMAVKAIAGEVVDGPYLSALNQVKSLHMEALIDVRKGDGLEVLKTGEATAISICGMGGALITSILENGKDKLSGDERLILQPNIGANSIRNWLLIEGWELINEEIIEEDGKIYEILVAEKGEALKPYRKYASKEAAVVMGPFLIEERSDIFLKKWDMELKNWRRILKQLDESKKNIRTEEKRKEIQTSIRLVEEVVNG